MNDLLFGADPEQFSVYMNADGESCAFPPYKFRHNLGVPSTFDPNLSFDDPVNKHPVFIEGDGYKIHEDGCAFEYAVRPSHNPREVFDMVQFCMKEVSEKILSHFPEYCLPMIQPLPTVTFEVERWKNEISQGLVDKDGFDMSTRFGCDPDLDAFNTQAKAQVLDVTEHDKRYAGGHIHISGVENLLLDPILAVSCLALTSGLAAVANTDVPQMEYDRTFYYGRPGKYRIQNYGKKNPFGKKYQYGVEYRTPSTRWTSSWDIASQVFKWAEIGMNILFPTKLGPELVKEIMYPAREAILSADRKEAKLMLAYIESRL
jgi:hypothetical protein